MLWKGHNTERKACQSTEKAQEKKKITEWSIAKRQKAELKVKHGVKRRIPQKLGTLEKTEAL